MKKSCFPQLLIILSIKDMNFSLNYCKNNEDKEHRVVYVLVCLFSLRGQLMNFLHIYVFCFLFDLYRWNIENLFADHKKSQNWPSANLISTQTVLGALFVKLNLFEKNIHAMNCFLNIDFLTNEIQLFFINITTSETFQLYHDLTLAFLELYFQNVLSF